MAIFEQFKRMLPQPRQTFPIFPLNTVLFPGGVLPIKVFEERYMNMTKQCLQANSVFGVCLIVEGQEVGSPAVPENVGCTARISDWDMEQLGVLQIRTLGEERFRIIERHTSSNGLIVAEAEMIPAEEEVEVPIDFSGCTELVRKVIERVGAESFAPPYRYENASWVGYRLSELLPIKVAAKQKLMELTDPMARLEVLAQFLTQQGLMR